MSKYIEIFEANKDLSEDECVMEIYSASEGELTIKEAQSEYRSMAVEAGIIKTPAQKKVDWEDAVDGIDLSTTEGVNEAKAIGNDMEIGATTVAKYMKTLATESGVTLAVTASATRTPSKWKEVVEAFDEEEALNSPREEVAAKINEIGEFDDIKKANGLYNKLRREFGWEQPASMSSQLNEWFTENLDAEKSDIVEKGIEIGMSEGSANYYVGVYKIVNEILVSIND